MLQQMQTQVSCYLYGICLILQSGLSLSIFALGANGVSYCSLQDRMNLVVIQSSSQQFQTWSRIEIVSSDAALDLPLPQFAACGTLHLVHSDWSACKQYDLEFGSTSEVTVTFTIECEYNYKHLFFTIHLKH